MAAKLVQVSKVSIDPPYTRRPGRVRYRIRLVCGCCWWEDRDANAAPPDAKVAPCYAGHSEHRIALTPDGTAVAAERAQRQVTHEAEDRYLRTSDDMVVRQSAGDRLNDDSRRRGF